MDTINKNSVPVVSAATNKLFDLSILYSYFVIGCITTCIVISFCPILSFKNLLVKHQFICLLVSFVMVWYLLKKIKLSSMFSEGLSWLILLALSIGFLYRQESIVFLPTDQSKLDVVFKSIAIFILCSLAGFNFDYNKKIFDKVLKVFSVSLLLAFILNLMIDLGFIYKGLLLITTVLQIISMSKYIYEAKQVHHVLAASILYLSFYALVLSLI